HRQVLAHIANGLFERIAPHVLDDDLMRQTDAQREATTTRRLHGQGLSGENRRMARVYRYDRGAELDVRNLTPDDGEDTQRLEAKDLRHPHRRETVIARSLRLGDRVIDGGRFG